MPDDLSKSTDQQDLFSEPKKELPPSQGVYCDMGQEELFHIGEVQMPSPMPVELVVEVGGWDYIYSLTDRRKSQ